jgi:hypothetical protein
MIDAADTAYALTELKARQKRYATYASYAAGKQPLSFSTDQWEQAFSGLFKRLAYNRCRAVVDAFANRLIVTGWESPATEEGQTDALGEAAQAIWDRTRMPKRQGELMAEAMRSGDAYVIVWPGDDGLARLDINRGHLIYPVYDDEYPERLSYAVKCWQVQHGANKGKWRVTTYDADSITRWISKSSSDDYPEKPASLIPYEDDAPPEIRNDYGETPVFHFGNNADTGSCGTSELVDVIPLQDGLNKSIADMLIAGEYVSFPQRWVVGAAPVRDQFTNEEVEQFKAAVDRVWGVDDPNARFGQFDPANMSQYTESQDAWDLKISRVSMVPVHWLSMTGEFPSGESLKTAEGPFTTKVKDRQIGFGDTMGDMMAFALRVEGVAQQDAVVTPIWAPAETRSDREALEAAAMKKAIGVPDFQVWAELGYSTDEIAEFTAAKEAAAQRQQDMFARSFDRGDVETGVR